MNFNKILISFIIPTYNSEKLITEAIDSILIQDYLNIEIIVVDGGSEDLTLEKIKSYGDKITVCISEPDKGIYDAINKGIKLSKGSVIKILNSDDLLTHNSISHILPIIKEMNNKSLKEFNIMSTIERISYSGKFLKIWDNNERLGFFENWNHVTWYTSRFVYEKYGLYSLDYKIASDYEYYMRQLKNKVKLIRINVPLVKHREGGVSDGFTGIYEVFMIKKEFCGLLLAVGLYLQIKSFKILIQIRNKFFRV